MAKLQICIYFALPIISSYLIHRFSLDYHAHDFAQYTSILISVSSMVFTIMGIWIAFLYPNALSRIVDPTRKASEDFSESLHETKRLESIVLSILKSAVVVLGIMLIYLSKVLLSNTVFYVNYLQLVKTAALAWLILLSWLQVEAVCQVGYANIMFLNDLHNKREEAEVDRRI